MIDSHDDWGINVVAESSPIELLSVVCLLDVFVSQILAIHPSFFSLTGKGHNTQCAFSVPCQCRFLPVQFALASSKCRFRWLGVGFIYGERREWDGC